MDLNELHRHLSTAIKIVEEGIDQALASVARPTTKTEATAAPVAQAPAPAPAPAPAKPKAPKTPPPPKYTVADVRTELLKVIEGPLGNDGAKEILAGFNAKKVSALTEDQFPAVIAAIQKVLATAATPEVAEDDDPTA